MIIIRTPFRVSFLGGGTDIPVFYENFGGAVLSTSINKYIYLSGHRLFDSSGYLLKYMKTESVAHVQDIRHPIFREVLSGYDISGLDIGVSSDFPAGTGLGSSSSFTVGLINLAECLSGGSMAKEELAAAACFVEIERLGEPIGKQDQYAAAIGGLNQFVFQSDGSVDVAELELSESDQQILDESMFLVKVPGPSRSASDQLRTSQNFIAHSASAQSALRDLKSLAVDGADQIRREGIEVLPGLISEAWQLKLRSSPNTATDVAAPVISEGSESGATAWKLLGAGGGGFVLFWVPRANQDFFLEQMKLYKIVPIKSEQEGTTVIYDAESHNLG